MDARHDSRQDVLVRDVGGRREGPGIGEEQTGPGNLYAFDFGCETWLFWDKSTDDVDPQAAIRYEIRVNGVFDGAQNDIDRWITYGTQAANTYSVQASDGSGNRSPLNSITLTNQSC